MYPNPTSFIQYAANKLFVIIIPEVLVVISLVVSGKNKNEGLTEDDENCSFLKKKH